MGAKRSPIKPTRAAGRSGKAGGHPGPALHQRHETGGALWWSERLLAAAPVRRVFVCGARLSPPAGSQIANFPQLDLSVAGKYETQLEMEGRVATVRLTPGCALFAPPGAWHLPGQRQPAQLISLLFGSNQLRLNTVSLKGTREPPVPGNDFSLPRPLSGPVRRIMDTMVCVALDPGLAAALPDLTRGLLTCLRKQLQCPTPDTAREGRFSLEEVCAFLQAHHHSEISRETVAQRFGISPSHLSRLFRQRRQVGFSRYLAQMRIEHAQQLLKDASLKLDAVAARSGFGAAPYFCRVFKSLVKETPGTFRASQT